MVKKKSIRKKLKQPDEFITFTGKMIEWGQKNLRQIGVVAIVLVGLLLAGVGYRYYNNQKEMQGFTRLNQARVKYATEVKKADTPEKVYEAVQADYQDIINDYPGKGAGRIARKKLADICFDAKKYDQAIELYKQSLVDFKKDPFYRAIILDDLASACEANKNDEAAERYFKMILASPDAPAKDEAMFHLAGLYEKQGKTDSARELYEKINSEYAESIYINIIREKIAG